MPPAKKRSRRAAKPAVMYGNSVLLRLAVGAVLLGMAWAAVPLAKAITTSITEVAERTFSAVVTAPVAGTALTGSVALEASVSGTANSGMFYLTGGPNSVRMPIDGAQDGVDPLKWTAKLDATNLASGSYNLAFSAIRSLDGMTATSPQISLTVPELAPPPYLITFLAPKSGASVTGAVTLTAGVNRAVDSMTYVVAPTGGGGLVELKSNYDSKIGTWSATWNTGEFPNGTYTIVAHAFHAAVMEQSDPVTVTVSNAAPPPTFTISVRTPSPGGTLSGIATISAATNLSAIGLTYSVTDANGNAVASLNATPSNNGQSWSATWDTTTVSNGNYSLIAKSIRDGAQAETGAVRFAVGNQAESTLLTVTMSAPAKGATVSGSTQVYAQTSLAADSLTFSIAQTFGNHRSTELKATGGPTAWYAPWDASGWEAGTYAIQATAMKGTGANLSDEVTFNVSAPAPNAPAPVTAGVNVTVPVAGATIAGQVALAARTDAAVDVAGFQMRSATNTAAAPVATVAANGSDGGISWTASLNTTSIPDGEYVIVAIVTRNGIKSSSVEVPVHLKNLTSGQTAVPSFEIRSPQPGAVVSGTVPFYASAASAIDGLAFVLEGPTIPGGRMALPAAGNAEKTAWTSNWNTTTVPDGLVSLLAVASKSGHEAAGAPRSFMVSNGVKPPATTEPVPPPVAPPAAPPATNAPAPTATSTFKVSVLSPSPSAIVAGQVPLVASVEGGTALTVRFAIGAATGGVTANIDARFDSSTRRWVATWKPEESAVGAFVVTAAAQSTRGVYAQSERVRVMIASKPPESPSNGTVPPLPGTEPAVRPPETKPSLFVKLLSPAAASVLRGPVVLSAEATGAIAVSFAVRPAGSGEPVQRQAANEGSRWSAYLDSSALPDGEYLIEVSATDGTGGRAVAPRISVVVRNAGAPAPIARVEVVPPAAVVASATARPEGSVSLSSDPLPKSVTDATDALNAECVAKKVPADRCREWLAGQSQQPECAAAGIATKEECLAFLKASHGGTVPACDGKSEEECARIVARATAGLLSDDDLRVLREAALANVGKVLRLPPRGEQVPAEGGVPPAPPALADRSPFAGDTPVNVSLHASPGFGTTDGNVAHQNLPAFLMVDTDNDNLPDDIELRIGTDPKNPDTDGDGYGDGLEVERGYNPLGPGTLADNVKLAPIDQAVISGIAIEQPKDAGTVVPDLKVETATVQDEKPGTFTIGGVAKPHDVVTVFVYSYLPVVFTTEAKDDGTWSYDLGSGLADGQHEAYATVTDDTGKITSKSNPLSFFVSDAKAVSQEDFFNPTDSPLAAAAASEPSQLLLGWYVGAVALVMAVALIVTYLLFLRPKKIPPLPPPQ